MAKQTQYSRILQHLIKVGSRGATYLSIAVAARSGSPWKRIAELEAKGYRFTRTQVEYDHRRHTVVSLAGRPQP